MLFDPVNMFSLTVPFWSLFQCVGTSEINRCNDFDSCTKESHAGKFAVLCARNFASLASKVSLYFHQHSFKLDQFFHSKLFENSVWGEILNICRFDEHNDHTITTQTSDFVSHKRVPVIDGIQARRDARDTVLGPTWIQKQSHETNLLPVIEHSNRTFQ